jgi:hypothetical protein
MENRLTHWAAPPGHSLDPRLERGLQTQLRINKGANTSRARRRTYGVDLSRF